MTPAPERSRVREALAALVSRLRVWTRRVPAPTDVAEAIDEAEAALDQSDDETREGR